MKRFSYPLTLIFLLLASCSLVLPGPTTPTPAASPPTFSPTPGIGSNMPSEKDNMTLLYVPTGEFAMGSENGEADEKPVHTVYLDAFWIDQTEVTNGQYAACVSANECVPPSYTGSRTRSSYYGNSEFDNFPVIYVDWNQAKAYCSWAGRRLPTEAEWEKAARGTDGNTYPWGNDVPNRNLLNYNSNVGDTTAVGNYQNGAIPYGAYDMAGNVMEWVNDVYSETYYQGSPSSNPLGPDASSGAVRVLRGGSWYDLDVRSANRYRDAPVFPADHYGFRCASSE